MAATANDPCQNSLFSQVFSGNVIVCSTTFKDYETSSAQDSIQKIADNAAQYYNQEVADVSQTAAAQQETQIPTDIQNVNDQIAKSTTGQIFTTCDSGDGGLAIPGLPCMPYTYFLYGGILLAVLYILALVNSFVPRPR